MATVTKRIELGPDEFAFHFQTNVGVDADALATFLKRSSTVARRHGGELRIVGLHQGSLDVVIKALKKNAKKEFLDKPIDTAIKTSAFVGTIVYAIAQMMSPLLSGGTPIAKAGADIVENDQVTQITIVTNDDSVLVMDKQIAQEVRQASERQHLLDASEPTLRLAAPVAGMLRDARTGDLSGETSMVKGELHFQPDGYRYWVPIDENPVTSNGIIRPGRRYKVAGHIALIDGQPDRIVVDQATPLPK